MAGFDLNSIMSLVTGSGASALGKSVGADEKKVNSVVSAAVPLLIGKMEDNTSTKAGAKSLNKALSDHAGDDITDIASFLSNADTDDGEKILKHIANAYRLVFNGGTSLFDAVNQIIDQVPDSPEIRHIVEFLQATELGIIARK